MNRIDFQAKIAALIAVFVLLLIAMAVHGRPAHAGSFYPACLKPDGDWLHGVTRRECVGKDVRGHWYTARVLKRARRVI